VLDETRGIYSPIYVLVLVKVISIVVTSSIVHSSSPSTTPLALTSITGNL